MGDSSRMDNRNHQIILYSPQSDAVIKTIERDGVCFSKPEYISAKYGESAPIFLTAYQWFAPQAQKVVPKPEGAQFPYWAVADRRAVDASGGGTVLTLQVPREQAIYFNLYDWNKILQLRCLTDDPKEEQEFLNELSLRGLTAYQVMMSDFYPEEKQKILNSWERLFLYHQKIAAGEELETGIVQAALWCIRKEWLCKNTPL